MRAPDVLRVFTHAAELCECLAILLKDNGCVSTAWHPIGSNMVEAGLLARDIA